jgi:hypothetical protein
MKSSSKAAHRFARGDAGRAHERVHAREREHSRSLVVGACVLQLMREREEHVLHARGETARVELQRRGGRGDVEISKWR